VRRTRIAIVARRVAAALRLIYASPKAAILRQVPGKSRGIHALMRLALILAAIQKSLHLLGRFRQNRPGLGHDQQQRTMLRIAGLLRQTHALDRMTAEQLGATHTPPLPTIKLSLPIVAKSASLDFTANRPARDFSHR
jgi:hypothetical protein